MRKIGSITPLWNQETFIKPHFDMLSSLDRNLVLLQPAPLPSYHNEHGYAIKKDLSEDILRSQFPNVEIVTSYYPPELDFGAGLYNEGLVQMRDCDIVLRLDPDMLFTEKDWKDFIDYIRNTDYDYYRMDFSKDSINYYMTWDYDHGMKDAKEFDALAVNPNILFTGILDYPSENGVIMDINPDWMCHHFRGWQKPKSVPSYWAEAVPEHWVKENGGWLSCPTEIKDKMEKWHKELDTLKAPLTNQK